MSSFEFLPASDNRGARRCRRPFRTARQIEETLLIGSTDFRGLPRG